MWPWCTTADRHARDSTGLNEALFEFAEAMSRGEGAPARTPERHGNLFSKDRCAHMITDLQEYSQVNCPVEHPDGRLDPQLPAFLEAPLAKVLKGAERAALDLDVLSLPVSRLEEVPEFLAILDLVPPGKGREVGVVGVLKFRCREKELLSEDFVYRFTGASFIA